MRCQCRRGSLPRATTHSTNRSRSLLFHPRGRQKLSRRRIRLISMDHIVGRYLVALSCLSAGYLTSCSPCIHSHKSEERSPSGQLIATVSVVDCGAVGHDVTQVNIRRADAAFSGEAGLALVAKDPQLVTTSWRDDRSLIIYLPKSLFAEEWTHHPIVLQRTRVGAVEIEYKVL